MKKTYLSPSTTITNVELQLLNNASITGVGGDSGIGMGSGETPGTAGSRRRRRNDWDDDDEEEEW